MEHNLGTSAGDRWLLSEECPPTTSDVLTWDVLHILVTTAAGAMADDSGDGSLETGVDCVVVSVGSCPPPARAGPRARAANEPGERGSVQACGGELDCGVVMWRGELWWSESQPLGADAGVAQPGERGGPAYAFCLAAARLFFCERAIVHVRKLAENKPRY